MVAIVTTPPGDRPWTRGPVLTVEHLTMRFGGLVAVNDLSFQAGRGDITALIGPNGAGKTTLFNLISGFTPPTAGEARFRGRSLAGQTPQKVACAGIGRTFHFHKLCPKAHDWNGTGKSLKLRSNHCCIQCQRQLTNTALSDVIRYSSNS